MHKKAFLYFNMLSGIIVFNTSMPLTINKQIFSPQQREVYIVALEYEKLHQTKSAFTYDKMIVKIGTTSAEHLGINAPDPLGTIVELIIIKSYNKVVSLLYTVNKDFCNEAAGLIEIYAQDKSDEF